MKLYDIYSDNNIDNYFNKNSKMKDKFYEKYKTNDNFRIFLKDKYYEPKFDGKVAIVGNGGSVLNNEFGSLIDSHDHIVRFNYAQVNGYENHIGNNTTLRVVGGKALQGTDSEEIRQTYPGFKSDIYINVKENVFVFTTTYLKGLDGFTKYSFDNGITFLDLDKILPKIKSFTGVNNPTSGFIFLMFVYFQKRFDSISLFGFDFFMDNKSRHYFEDVRRRTMKPGYSGSHGIQEEMIFCKELAKETNINLYR
jgi:hypothetical protein|tara:strand:- start:4971 stop:5726 length:756 start_codon:yes stop_codon:yes gene_type:complete